MAHLMFRVRLRRSRGRIDYTADSGWITKNRPLSKQFIVFLRADNWAGNFQEAANTGGARLLWMVRVKRLWSEGCKTGSWIDNKLSIVWIGMWNVWSEKKSFSAAVQTGHGLSGRWPASWLSPTIFCLINKNTNRINRTRKNFFIEERLVIAVTRGTYLTKPVWLEIELRLNVVPEPPIIQKQMACRKINKKSLSSEPYEIQRY